MFGRVLEGGVRTARGDEAGIGIAVVGVEHGGQPLGEGVVVIGLGIGTQFLEDLQAVARAPRFDQSAVAVTIGQTRERGVGVQEHLLGGVSGVIEGGVVGEEGQGLLGETLGVEFLDALVGAIEVPGGSGVVAGFETQQTALKERQHIGLFLAGLDHLQGAVQIALGKGIPDARGALGVGAAAGEREKDRDPD